MTTKSSMETFLMTVQKKFRVCKKTISTISPTLEFITQRRRRNGSFLTVLCSIVEFRLTSTFCSPGCAIFGLKRSADDGEQEFGKEAACFVQRDFYVDNGIKTVETS